MGKIVAILRQVWLGRPRLVDAKGKTLLRAPLGRADMSAAEPAISVAGALWRGFAVMAALAAPAVLVPQIGPETGQVLLLVGLFAGLVVTTEYLSRFPALIEFRFAPPYNRIRFGLGATVLLALALLQRAAVVEGGLSALVATLAASAGNILDFPGTPLRLLVMLLEPGADPAAITLVRNGAGLAALLVGLVVALFALAVRFGLWPARQGPLNVWINLPTFEPTAGEDVVVRLDRLAKANIALGLVMPAVVPGWLFAGAAFGFGIDLTAPVPFIFGIAAWAILPALMIMRGLAMGRVAQLIREGRRRHAAAEARAYAAA